MDVGIVLGDLELVVIWVDLFMDDCCYFVFGGW